MLQSEHIRSLPPDVKQKSIMVALDAAGVKVAEIVEDAVQRDRALDTYERVLQKHLEDLRAQKAAENQQLEDEINQRVAELRAQRRPERRRAHRRTEQPAGLAGPQAPGRRSHRRGRRLLRVGESDHDVRPRRQTREAPMFDRLGRLFRAWMGFFISMGEDPEVMLQDAIEEMRITMPKLNSVLVATRATVIRLEEERDALRRQDKNLTGVDPGGAARRHRRRAQRGRGGRHPAAAGAHGSAGHRGAAGLGAEGARERAAVGGHAEAEAQGKDRDLPARAEGTAEGGGHEVRRRRDRRAAVLRRGLDRRQVPRADQAGSRRVEGGRRSGHRLDRHQGHRARAHRRARSRRRASCTQFEVEMGLAKPVAAPQSTAAPSVGGRVGEKQGS